MICKHPQEICGRMMFYHGKTYCDSDGLFCQLYDEPPESDSNFAEQVMKYSMENPVEILNWYRNSYYQEPSNSEKGIMARAINDLLMKYKEVFSG